MTSFPQPLPPGGRQTEWLNRLLRACQERCAIITSSPGEIKTVTTQGTHTRSLAPPAAPSTSGDLPVWR